MSGDRARILVIDDEAPIRRFLRICLEGAGHSVIEAENGRAGVKRAATDSPDVILLDLGLPDIDGKAVIEDIRGWSRVPILILSVRNTDSEKIAALDAGADDYVTKPFSHGELLARLRVLIRNRQSVTAEASEFCLHDLVLDFPARRVLLAGQEVRLTRKEFEVLCTLARHAGRLVTHRHLLETIWGPAHRADTHYLRVVVGHLRDKLGDDAANPKYLITEPGVGYRMPGE
jgi:two-component system KDP operon response regulator KdpE